MYMYSLLYFVISCFFLFSVAAFNIDDSDTDEDIDIPGTGSQKHGIDPDDFDFYG